jgi:hypothetical protein
VNGRRPAGSSLEVIAARWPRVGRWLAAAPPPEGVCAAAHTLIFNGIHLTCARDRQTEAARQARLIPPGSREAWVYGPALGDLPRLLLQRPELQRLVVTPLNPAVFRAALAFCDGGDWLNDPRLELQLPGGQAELRAPFAAGPAELRLASDDAARLRDLVVLELATPHIQRAFRPDAALGERLRQNRAIFAADPGVETVFDSCPGVTALVAAAGPTLGSHLARLRRWQAGQGDSGGLLICVDAAYRPLAAAGLRPEYVVCIDEKPETQRFLEAGSTARGGLPVLVYFPGIQPAILRNWGGGRLAALPAQPGRLEAALPGLPDKGRLFSSGSVLHPAVDLAVRLGAQRIVLLGADFCYPGRLTHVEGAVCARPAPQQAGAWVLNGRGQRTPTRVNLMGFLRDLEGYIAAHPGVEFVNTSLEGADIQGAAVVEAWDA